MLEKTESYTSIDIKELGQVSLRKTNRITDSGSIVSENHHREVRTPGEDISDLPQLVQNTINSYWTTEIVSSWNSFISSSME